MRKNISIGRTSERNTNWDDMIVFISTKHSMTNKENCLYTWLIYYYSIICVDKVDSVRPIVLGYQWPMGCDWLAMMGIAYCCCVCVCVCTECGSDGTRESLFSFLFDSWRSDRRSDRQSDKHSDRHSDRHTDRRVPYETTKNHNNEWSQQRTRYNEWLKQRMLKQRMYPITKDQNNEVWNNETFVSWHNWIWFW